MITDDPLMAGLRRANPVPTDEDARSDVSGHDFLATELQRSNTMSVLERTVETNESPRPRWPRYGAAAAVVLLVGALVAVLAARGDDSDVEPVTTIEDTTPPTTTAETPPEPSTVVPAGAIGLAEEFVAARSGSDPDAFTELVGSGFVQTYSPEFGQDAVNLNNPAPPFELIQLEQAAWQAQGLESDLVGCIPADDQLERGSTIWCEWDIRNALALAVDEPAEREGALIVVDGDEVVGFHLTFEPSQQYEDLENAISSWMNVYHPGHGDEVVCCTPDDTIDDAVAAGEARARWAADWATWLEQWGCSWEQDCQISIDEWVAEYEARCTTLDDPTTPSAAFADEMTLVPPPSTEEYEKNRLLTFDANLREAESDADVAATQAERLALLTTLGVDSACHPAPG